MADDIQNTNGSNKLEETLNGTIYVLTTYNKQPPYDPQYSRLIMPISKTQIHDLTTLEYADEKDPSLVMPPIKADRHKFLSGDGTWKELSVNTLATFKGATEVASGIQGIVPAPTIDDRNKFLSGNGRWESIIQEAFTGAKFNQDGTIGLVPVPEALDRNKFLRGNGDWTDITPDDVPVFENSTANDKGKKGLVPAPPQTDREGIRYLCADGKWRYLAEELGDVLRLSSRVDFAERRISELFLYLAAKELYPDSTSLVYGIFGSYDDDIDMTETDVLSAIAGDDSLNVTSLDGLIIGSYYTLTDGNHQETVQIKALAKIGDTNRVVLYQPIINDYAEDYIGLYRTTAFIYERGAEGSGDNRTNTWRPNRTWTGLVAGEDFTFKMDLSLDNVDQFDIIGDATIDEDNNATLWTEKKIHIALPVQSPILTYNGRTQTATFSGV